MKPAVSHSRDCELNCKNTRVFQSSGHGGVLLVCQRRLNEDSKTAFNKKRKANGCGAPVLRGYRLRKADP